MGDFYHQFDFNLPSDEASQEINIDPALLNIDESSDVFNGVEENFDIKSGILCSMGSSGPPPRGDFPGYYRFNVFLSSETSNKKKYIYSHILNRVYLCMMTELPVQFQWDWDLLKGKNLFIRATLILAKNEHQEARVLRCSIHKEPAEVSNNGIPEEQVPHVLRSARIGPDVLYCGDEHNPQSWLSVGFEPASQPPDGVSAIQHVYMFCCKHSCISGINRRPVEVLFTLEDFHGAVLGRRSLGVRVCSCPKRDLEKDEEEFRQRNGSNGPPTKKRKLQHSATNPLQNINTNETVLATQSLLNVSMLALRHIPPDNPVIPHLQNVIKELQKQHEPIKT